MRLLKFNTILYKEKLETDREITGNPCLSVNKTEKKSRDGWFWASGGGGGGGGQQWVVNILTNF
jgi:hypothetical protein